MQYFGTGEYPYKTILKQTDCESIASDLSNMDTQHMLYTTMEETSTAVRTHLQDGI